MQNASLNSCSVGETAVFQQQPNETPELKARLAAVLQLYNEVMKENEQLKEVIKRGEEIARTESKKLNETLLVRDESIGALEVQVEQLQNANKKNKELFDRKYSVIESQLSLQQNKNLDLEKRNQILLSAFKTMEKFTLTRFCVENSQQSMEVFRTQISRSSLKAEYKNLSIAQKQVDVTDVLSLTNCVKETNKKLLKV